MGGSGIRLSSSRACCSKQLACQRNTPRQTLRSTASTASAIEASRDASARTPDSLTCSTMKYSSGLKFGKYTMCDCRQECSADGEGMSGTAVQLAGYFGQHAPGGTDRLQGPTRHSGTVSNGASAYLRYRNKTSRRKHNSRHDSACPQWLHTTQVRSCGPPYQGVRHQLVHMLGGQGFMELILALQVGR
jgi:hypothetical protein